MILGQIHSTLQTLDWIVIFVYFVFIVILGLFFAKKQKTSERYFLANRSLPGWAVGMSIFATIISSWTFLAIPGKSFKSDLQYFITVILIPITALLICMVIIPVFRNKIRLSAYKYLEHRFGILARIYGDIGFILNHFFKMAMVLYLLCLAVAGVTGWNIFTLIILIGIATITYTLFGGIEAVIWTDVIQGTLLICGGVIALFFLIFKSPIPPAQFFETAYNAGKLKLANFSFNFKDISFYVLLLFGFNHYATKYCTDQTVVQRYLLSKSTKQAYRSLWTSVALILLVWVVFMLIGALLWVFYDIQSELLPPEVRAKPDQVFAFFIGSQLPAGITGILLAGLFAATMSTLSSDLNSLAAVILEDFYNMIKPNTKDKTKLLFSRLTVLVTGICSIILAMSMTKIESMVETFFDVSSILAGGLLAMFLLGLLTKRARKTGVYIALAVGVLFITWATITDLYPNFFKRHNIPLFEMNILWLGLLGNIIVFVTGYAASVILTPNYRADESLTIYKSKT